MVYCYSSPNGLRPHISKFIWRLGTVLSLQTKKLGWDNIWKIFLSRKLWIIGFESTRLVKENEYVCMCVFAVCPQSFVQFKDLLTPEL